MNYSTQWLAFYIQNTYAPVLDRDPVSDTEVYFYLEDSTTLWVYLETAIKATDTDETEIVPPRVRFLHTAPTAHTETEDTTCLEADTVLDHRTITFDDFDDVVIDITVLDLILLPE